MSFKFNVAGETGKRALSAALCACLPITTFAHTDGPLTPERAFNAWATEPLPLASLIFTAWLYGVGWIRIRHASPRTSSLPSLLVFFLCGWLVLLIALVSPVHAMGQLLFSVHMCQHELLMVVAAPLLVLARPLAIFTAALPRRSAQTFVRLTRARFTKGAWHFLNDPFVAWLIHALALWLWHVPSWFSATLDNEWIHAAQHISFFATALLFWQSVLRSRHRQRAYGAAVIYLFTTAVHSGALGALLTFASHVIYPPYASTARLAGLTPLEDQQLGGLIMWIPAGIAYVAAGLILFARWLRFSDSVSAPLRHPTAPLPS